jgi:hypothetical protein
MKLGICMIGMVKNQNSQRYDVEFSHWIQRHIKGFQAGVVRHPSCNAAMSIIEWMRGEEIVLVPNNRIIMASGNASFENYYRILPRP